MLSGTCSGTEKVATPTNIKTKVLLVIRVMIETPDTLALLSM